MITLEEKLKNIHLKICFQIKKKIVLVEKTKNRTRATFCPQKFTVNSPFLFYNTWYQIIDTKKKNQRI